MTTSLKDVSTAIMIGKLADMNAFEKEYDAWGYGWCSEEGRVRYSLSENLMELRQLRELQRIDGVAMTPLVAFAERAIVRDEERDDWMYVRKLHLADKIRCDFPQAYYDILAQVTARSCDNAALGILAPWKDEIAGYFDESSCALFEGALLEARRARHVDKSTFDALRLWLASEKKQALGAAQRGMHVRVFLGCAYEESQAMKFYVNANAEAFFERYETLKAEKTLVTPVYSRTEHHEKAVSGSVWRQDFLQHIANIMDERYFERIEMLGALPTAIPDDVWRDALSRMKVTCGEAANEAFMQWGARMGRIG